MIKLLIGGSPCTYWSIAQKNNRETTAEGLGWELFKNYLIAKEKFKPDFFLYENNKSAAKAIKEQIKKELKVWDGTLLMEDTGARYIEINSALVSAQNRQRFYVHNCGEVGQPEDRGVLLRDILETGISLSSNDKSFCLTTRCNGAISEDTLKRNRHEMVAEPIRIPSYGNYDKSRPIRASYAYKGAGVGSLQSECFPDNPNKQVSDYIAEPVRVGALPRPNGELSTSQAMRIYSVDGKSVTQSAGGGGMGGQTWLYAIPFEQPENYLGEKMVGYAYKEGTKNFKQRIKILGDKACPLTTEQNKRAGTTNYIPQNVETVECEITTDGTKKNAKPIYEVKDGKITIKGKQYPIKLADGFYIIRKLTVTECARLQTMPDDYCHYGREIVKQIFYKGNDEWKNVELMDVITKSQTVATDYVTNIVCDCKDMGQRNLQEKELIKVKNAKLMVAKDNVKATRATVICTTNGGKNMELSNCLKEILKNAKFAVKLQLQKDYVQSIIKISKNTEMQDTLITYEAVLTNMDTKNINTHITKLNIELLQKECLVDNSQKMILSTILTLISQIMMKTTYIYAHKANIVDYTMSLKSVQPNFIEMDLLSLRTDTTNLMSSCQAYKGLGNGWTAEVIIHILNGALKNVPKDEEIVVLSMYDGIGTGRYCLDKMGFTNVKYYAYEIDKYAKQIAMSNYPDIIQMGDAFALRNDNWSL